MKRFANRHRTIIDTTQNLREGQSIEEVMRVNTANKTMPEQVFPELYQERNEGIDPLCDIRTDKWDIAQAAMDKVSRAYSLASQNKEKLGGKADNTWITDEDGNPMFDAPESGDTDTK